MRTNKKYFVELEETFLDYPSPEGTAVIFFLSGCIHHCPGCQNPELQRPMEYEESAEELSKRITEFAKRCCTNKVVISGGDPLSPNNIEYTKSILNNLGKTFDICIYTGYNYEDVKSFCLDGYKYIKCGKFDTTQKQRSYKTDEKMQFASPNQELYQFGSDISLTKDGVFYFNK